MGQWMKGAPCTDGTDRPCYSGPKTTANTGLCKDGIQKCTDGTWDSTCEGETTPASETCDGQDEDCDGLPDNGNPGGGAACSTGKQGICSAGTETCQNAKIECVQNQQSTGETCNGKDDDCDGQTDENNPGGGANCNTGLKGECAAGTQQCSGGTLSCQQNVNPKSEICNNKDDDCDGQTDEGDPGGGGGCTLTALKGLCRTGVNHCTNGSVTCTQTVFPVPEICNGKDENCDGVVDDGNWSQACSVPGKLGPCKNGNRICSGGGFVCQQTVFPKPEICFNNIDENCNGFADDGCCPYVFSDTGESFEYETTVGGVALIGKAVHLTRGKRIDFMPMWVRLDRARVQGGKLRTKIMAAEDEIVYLDEARLTVVEHPPGTEVFTSTSESRRSFEAAADWDFLALESASLRAPLRALHNEEADVTVEIGQLSDRAVAADPTRDNTYDLDFGPVAAAAHPRLVIDGWRLRFDRKLPPHLLNRQPCLEVKQLDGSWKEVRALGAPRGDRKAVCIDLAGIEFPTGRYEIRVRTGTAQAGTGMWFIDRVRLSEAAAESVQRREVVASRARLEFFGCALFGSKCRSHASPTSH